MSSASGSAAEDAYKDGVKFLTSLPRATGGFDALAFEGEVHLDAVERRAADPTTPNWFVSRLKILAKALRKAIDALRRGPEPGELQIIVDTFNREIANLPDHGLAI